MRNVRALRVLAVLFVVAAIAGCGDGDSPAAPSVPEPLAYFEFASGAGGRIVADAATAFSGGALADQEPDFAGAEITGIALELGAVSITSPGRDPNDDGLWTDVMIQGQVVILGHP